MSNCIGRSGAKIHMHAAGIKSHQHTAKLTGEISSPTHTTDTGDWTLGFQMEGPAVQPLGQSNHHPSTQSSRDLQGWINYLSRGRTSNFKQSVDASKVVWDHALPLPPTSTLPLLSYEECFHSRNQYIEGSRPEWCISSMIYSGDTPFWSETLDIDWKVLSVSLSWALSNFLLRSFFFPLLFCFAFGVCFCFLFVFDFVLFSFFFQEGCTCTQRTPSSGMGIKNEKVSW